MNDAQDVGIVDSGDADPGVADVAADPAAVSADPNAVPPADSDDPFATEHGLVAKRPDGRQNRIPYDRVKAISETQVRKALKPYAEALGIKVDDKTLSQLDPEAVMTAFTERNTKYSDYESQFEHVRNIEKVMATDGDRMIRMLAQANPEMYGKFAKVLEQVADAAAGTEGQALSADDPNDPEPQPDYPVKDENGNIIGHQWTAEGLAKARAWDRRQAKRESALEFGKRIEPFEKERADREKAEQLAARQRQIDDLAEQAVTELLGRAEKWPLFGDNKKAIFDAVNANPKLDLRDAYINHVMPLIAADRNKMRAELIKEMQGAPNATSTATAAVPAAGDQNQSLEDVVRESIRAARLV